MRASLLARLLSGLQPDRRSVQQDQGYGAPSRSAHEGGFGGGVGRSAFGAQRPGRSRVFRACWLLSTSPITVKRAVRVLFVHDEEADLAPPSLTLLLFKHALSSTLAIGLHRKAHGFRFLG